MKQLQILSGNTKRWGLLHHVNYTLINNDKENLHSKKRNLDLCVFCTWFQCTDERPRPHLREKLPDVRSAYCPYGTPSFYMKLYVKSPPSNYFQGVGPILTLMMNIRVSNLFLECRNSVQTLVTHLKGAQIMQILFLYSMETFSPNFGSFKAVLSASSLIPPAQWRYIICRKSS